MAISTFPTPGAAKIDLQNRVQIKLDEGSPRHKVYENLSRALAFSEAVRVEPLGDYLSRKNQGGEEFKSELRSENNRVALVDRKNGIVLHMTTMTKGGKFIELDSKDMDL